MRKGKRSGARLWPRIVLYTIYQTCNNIRVDHLHDVVVDVRSFPVLRQALDKHADH